MKKILAIMLIAVIAVAGVFATTSVTGPTSVTLNYNITDKFIPSIKLTAISYNAKTNGTVKETVSTQDGNFSILAGENQDRFAEGRVDFSVLDASYVNATTEKVTKVSFACSDNWSNAKNTDDVGPSIIETAITPVTATGSTNTVDDSGKLVLTYPKETVLDRTAIPAEVGQYSVSWDADAETTHRAATTWSATVTVTLTAN